jgi:hypothetical protein
VDKCFADKLYTKGFRRLLRLCQMCDERGIPVGPDDCFCYGPEGARDDMSEQKPGYAGVSWRWARAYAEEYRMSEGIRHFIKILGDSRVDMGSERFVQRLVEIYRRG